MKSINYKAISWKDLTLALFDSLPHEHDFQIIAQRTFAVPHYSIFSEKVAVRLAVIGASHLVEFRTADFIFTEVFSCRKHFTQSPFLTYHLPPNTATETLDCLLDNDTLLYQVSFQNYHQSSFSSDFLPRYVQQCPHRIWVNFPRGEFEDVPFTAIGAGFWKDAFIIRSIHGYNHEQRIILSESKISMPKPNFLPGRKARWMKGGLYSQKQSCQV